MFPVASHTCLHAELTAYGWPADVIEIVVHDEI